MQQQNWINQELWGLIARSAQADKHFFKIAQMMMKIIGGEDGFVMTGSKQKVVEEIKLNWTLVRTIHEDLAIIAEELGQADFPALPDIDINDEMWETDTGGAGESIYQVNNAISAHQQRLLALAFQYQGLVADKA